MNGSLSMHSIQLLPMMTLLKLGRLRFRDTASRSASCESVKARLSVSINQLPCKTWLLSVACAGLPPPLLYPVLLSRSGQTRCSKQLKDQPDQQPDQQQHTATHSNIHIAQTAQQVQREDDQYNQSLSDVPSGSNHSRHGNNQSRNMVMSKTNLLQR